jgi:hypothetical protein
MNDGETSLPARCAAAFYLLALDDPAAAAFIRAGLDDHADVTTFHNVVEVLVHRMLFDRPPAWEVEDLTELLRDPRLRDPAEPAEPPELFWSRDMAGAVRYALDEYRSATRPTSVPSATPR